MVATVARGTSANYYLKQTEYFLGTHEPAGRWLSKSGDFGGVHGSEVSRELFQRLHAGEDEHGRLLLSNTGDVKERVAGFDVTFSAPKSVSIAYAIAAPELRAAIEGAQQRAVETSLDLLDRHAAFCRRGKDGRRLEAVSLTLASFQHGEARPVAHAEGKVFADPNLHTHCVILNLARRHDNTVGALDGRFLFAWKMAAGAAYHASLAAGLQKLGFTITEIGKNGIFEIGGVPEEVRRYFSARRQEVEDAIAREGLTTAQAPALASAIALGSRTSKEKQGPADRFALWSREAARFAIDRDSIQSLRYGRELTVDDREKLIAVRMAALPDLLTRHESVFEKRHLYAAVGAALVGTGAGPDRIDDEVDRLIRRRRVVELGRDDLNQPVYSTPEMIAIERELVSLAQRLAGPHRLCCDPKLVHALCRENGLTTEQTQAAAAVTGPLGIAIAEGAAGSGKTTLLGPVIESYRRGGARVIGTAQAHRIARQMCELGIEATATDRWIAKARAGVPFLDQDTVLLVDEAGLLSSRQMHALLSEVARTGAKAILLGDRRQLQAIGAGPGFQIVASVIEATRVDTIVRQREPWAREAVMKLAQGQVAKALQAFSHRGLLVGCEGTSATVRSLVDSWESAWRKQPDAPALLIAKTNAQVRAINEEVRLRLRAHGALEGKDVTVSAVTPSGHGQSLRFAKGDRVRFLVRQDAIGVINGTEAVIERITRGRDPRVRARIGKRPISFRVSELSDEFGRARLGHAYASTVYGAQGLTTDRAFVLLDPSMTRHDVYVAASRSKGATQLCFDKSAVDSQIRGEQLLSQRHHLTVHPKARLDWLARKLSRLQVKTCTLDPTLTAHDRNREPVRERSRELGHV